MSTVIRLLMALISGQPYPLHGAEDTEFNRELWGAIGADLIELELQGVTPEVPS
jgi:hypothetical protein